MYTNVELMEARKEAEGIVTAAGSSAIDEIDRMTVDERLELLHELYHATRSVNTLRRAKARLALYALALVTVKGTEHLISK